MTKYQTFWPRFCAGFVDTLVLIPIGFIDGYLKSPERGSLILIAWAVVSYTTYWLYSVLLHARYGQTFGKMAARVKVLDVSEQCVPTLRQAFIRDIGYIALNTFLLFYLIYLVVAGQYVVDAEVTTLPGLVLTWASLGWFLLEVISMATNDKRRAFHDYIAKTVVVRNA